MGEQALLTLPRNMFRCAGVPHVSAGTNMTKRLVLIAALSICVSFCGPPRSPNPAVTAIPTQRPTSTPKPTATVAPTETVTVIAPASPLATSRPAGRTPSPVRTATRQAASPPSACGIIPGTQRVGVGFFDLASRIVTFCNTDLAAMDVCELRTIEYCNCNKTSGCCSTAKADELSIGSETTILRYPAGTTSFQASIPQRCRTHNSDRVIIMAFPNPLP